MVVALRRVSYRANAYVIRYAMFGKGVVYHSGMMLVKDAINIFEGILLKSVLSGRKKNCNFLFEIPP